MTIYTSNRKIIYEVKTEKVYYKWFLCTHLTMFMRKNYYFRMIGKRLYIRPKK